MKKLIFTVGILTSFGSLFSCSKETIKPAPGSAKENNSEYSQTKMSGGGDLRVIWELEGHVWCDDRGGNCLPDVEVVSSGLQVIVADITDNGVSGNDQAVRNLINNNFNVLKTVVPENLLTDYLNKKLTLRIRENNAINSVFFIFSLNGNIVSAQPLILK